MAQTPIQEPQAAAPAAQNAPAIADRIAVLRRRLDPWLFVPSVLVSVIAGAGGSYFYLNSRVDAVISSRLERRMMPYQSYMAAQMQFTNEDPDRCADALSEVLPELDEAEFKGVSRAPFYDLAITCARDATYAVKYRGDVKRIEAALARGEAPSSGWHLGALGMFYFRTGDLELAEADLRKAVPMLNAEGWPSEEATIHWLLALLHLSRGQSGEAAGEYRRAAQLDPRVFEPALTQARFESAVAEPRLRFLRDNATFRQATPAFLAALAGPAPAP